MNPGATDITCEACGSFVAYRQCPHCGHQGKIPADVTLSKSWSCLSCNRESKAAKWLPLPIAQNGGVGEIKQQWVDQFGGGIYAVVSSPDRRRADGGIAATNLDGNAVIGGIGLGASIFFEDDRILLFVGAVETPVVIHYPNIIALHIGPREWVAAQNFTVGFGPTNSISFDQSVAVALKEFIAISPTDIQTIIHLRWTTGTITLLNTKLLTAAWVDRLAPIFSRLERQRDRAAEIGVERASRLERAEIAASRVQRSEAAHCGWLGHVGDIDFTKDLEMISESSTAAAKMDNLIQELWKLPNRSAAEDQMMNDAERRIEQLDGQAEERASLLAACAAKAEQIGESLHAERQQITVEEKRADVTSRMAAALYGTATADYSTPSPTADRIPSLVAAFDEVRTLLSSERLRDGLR